MKYYKMMFVFLFVSLSFAQDESIYFDNFDAIEFEVDGDLKILTFTINNEYGRNKIVIIKQGNGYVFSRINEEDYSEPVMLKNIRWMMPAIIKHFSDKHSGLNIQDVNQIINLIY